MKSHTPGPWSVSCVRTRESGVPVLQILAADGKPYAQVFYSDKTNADHAASYADARLIAAAPDMLAALKLVREFDCKHAPVLTHLPYFKAMHDAVFTAIGTAEGLLSGAVKETQ